MYLTFWQVTPLESSLKGLVIVYTHLSLSLCLSFSLRHPPPEFSIPASVCQNTFPFFGWGCYKHVELNNLFCNQLNLFCIVLWSLRMYMYIYKYIYTYACVCTYVYIYIYICVCVCTYVYVYIYIQVCVCVCICICTLDFPRSFWVMVQSLITKGYSIFWKLALTLTGHNLQSTHLLKKEISVCHDGLPNG